MIDNTMRYQWRQPVRMTSARLREVLGREPHTPLDEAVEATLAGQGPPAAGGAVAVSPRTT
jgi:nucleoside-diphosphate-sugar epimerase